MPGRGRSPAPGAARTRCGSAGRTSRRATWSLPFAFLLALLLLPLALEFALLFLLLALAFALPLALPFAFAALALLLALLALALGGLLGVLLLTTLLIAGRPFTRRCRRGRHGLRLARLAVGAQLELELAAVATE